jgi:hypothetical protein
MRALVVYESTFGNTESIAQAIAAGLAEHLHSDVVEVGAVSDQAVDDYDLLVAGAPTQGFSLSRAGSRENAAKQAGKGPAPRTGLREWLDSLPPARRGALAATFDTRFQKPRWLTGSAARAAAKRLDGRGYRLVVAPESFFVGHTEGPLQEGELERARAWGARLGAAPTVSAR